ncbi:MAG: hypothetical protein ABSH14_17690 [Verrucomicrobiia bacterium]|jgi:hypothetical protein
MKHCVHAEKPLGPFIVLCAHPVAQLYFGARAHIHNCAVCGYCRPDPTSAIGFPPLSPSVVGRVPSRGASHGLGDRIEKILKPVARALGSKCLDEHDNLKPDSWCAKRRDALNRVRLS